MLFRSVDITVGSGDQLRWLKAELVDRSLGITNVVVHIEVAGFLQQSRILSALVCEVSRRVKEFSTEGNGSSKSSDRVPEARPTTGAQVTREWQVEWRLECIRKRR